ncbi:MAG: DUF6561 domain-containing protein [Candidatus Nanopelagicaceae bacterium]|jgi:hypothetical protein
MAIKLALLKSGEQVITDAKELLIDDKVCGYYFIKPHKVRLTRPVVLTEEEEVKPDSVEVTLSPWILISKDEEMAVSADWVVTIVEPIDDVKEMYLEKTNGETDKNSGTNE